MAGVFSAFVALGPPPHSFFLSIPGKGWNGASVRGDELQNLMDRLQESSGAKINCLAFGQDGSHFVIFKEPDPDRTSKFESTYPHNLIWAMLIALRLRNLELLPDPKYVASKSWTGLEGARPVCGTWSAWIMVGMVRAHRTGISQN
jgi:hypothetical protein